MFPSLDLFFPRVFIRVVSLFGSLSLPPFSPLFPSSSLFHTISSFLFVSLLLFLSLILDRVFDRVWASIVGSAAAEGVSGAPTSCSSSTQQHQVSSRMMGPDVVTSGGGLGMQAAMCDMMMYVPDVRPVTTSPVIRLVVSPRYLVHNRSEIPLLCVESISLQQHPPLTILPPGITRSILIVHSSNPCLYLFTASLEEEEKYALALPFFSCFGCEAFSIPFSLTVFFSVGHQEICATPCVATTLEIGGTSAPPSTFLSCKSNNVYSCFRTCAGWR